MGVTVGSWDAWTDATGNLFVRRTARSVVLSGGYEECKIDKGNKIRLCGEGGRSKDGKMQLKDEEYTYGHKASQNAMRAGEPIRIIHRYKLDSKHAPRNGFHYDGSYIVIGCYEIHDENGFGSFYSTSSCKSSRLFLDYNA
ncbi:PUA-like domain-containing protein [Armillaria novae-zelandiae]|uniref:PUA-like domain-containing protein n=1 Tax=Armillaria novae-zelandiae TaxID=153914 RepID=A0AA39PCI7_9AGAR|nr:PUA-like domain-containing protein [Armillaria novae-zelandiae]